MALAPNTDSSPDPDSDPDADRRLLTLLAAAREHAGTSGRHTLVSFSERVPNLDLPGVLAPLPVEAAERSRLPASHGGAGHPTLTPRAAIERFYWSRPAEGFTTVAVGSALSISPSVKDRFEALATEWDRLIEGALIDDPSNGAKGVGPMLLGGFSFDPQLATSDRWIGFPPALFTLPRLQLTSVDGACWLTSNFIVAPSGRAQPEHDDWARERLAVLSVGGESHETPSSAFQRPVSLEWEDVHNAREWTELVARGISAIRDGEFAKVVLAREVSALAPVEPDASALVRRLGAAHPSCAIFACEVGGALFVGASPEQLAGTEGSSVSAASLAGTAPRGASEALDREAADQLLSNAKERQEHDVVRRAIVESLPGPCEEVSAEESPTVLTLPNVHHLYTAVRARLRPGSSPLHVVRALHPTPAVGGYPRDRALDFIREHEELDRGWYAAPIGWIQRDRSDFAVALRSALIRGRELSLYAGCGVMADSDPELEFAETLLKLRPMKAALCGAADGPPEGAGQADMDEDSTQGAVR